MGLRGQFFGREGLQLQGVDLAAHALAQRAIHQLVALQWPPAFELLAHHGGLEMHIVFRAHAHRCSGQRNADQLLDLFGIHGRNHMAGGEGPQV